MTFLCFFFMPWSNILRMLGTFSIWLKPFWAIALWRIKLQLSADEAIKTFKSKFKLSLWRLSPWVTC